MRDSVENLRSPKRAAPVLVLLALAAAGAPVCLAQDQAPGLQTTLAAGVPMHVTVTRSASMRVGAPVEGVLTEPVYVFDRLVLPAGAKVLGSVSRLEPLKGDERLKARLNGDLTPLREPVVNFDRVQLGADELQLASEGRVRQTETVRFVPKPKPTMRSRVEGLVHEKVQTFQDEVLAPGKGDRLLRLVYNQLPYHPQKVWRGTEFVADVTTEAAIELPAAQPEPARLEDAALRSSVPASTIVKARLTSTLDSDSAKKGETITAIVTEPLLDSEHRLVLPEGSQLEGTVTEAKPSRSLGRNGTLRFAFREVRRQGEPAEKIHGMIVGAEGSKQQNLTVDSEGEVKAQPDKNRFAAPLLLAVLAAGGHDDDGGAGQQVVGANGFGLVARLVTLAASSPNVAGGFGAYGFAKSVYFRFLARGHAVTFPKDTPLEIQLGGR